RVSGNWQPPLALRLVSPGVEAGGTIGPARVFPQTGLRYRATSSGSLPPRGAVHDWAAQNRAGVVARRNNAWPRREVHVALRRRYVRAAEQTAGEFDPAPEPIIAVWQSASSAAALFPLVVTCARPNPRRSRNRYR